jgi:hypothetical protein
VLDVVFELVLYLLSPLVEVLFETFGTSCPNLANSRVFWAVVLLVFAGIIWWELC